MRLSASSPCETEADGLEAPALAHWPAPVIAEPGSSTASTTRQAATVATDTDGTARGIPLSWGRRGACWVNSEPPRFGNVSPPMTHEPCRGQGAGWFRPPGCARRNGKSRDSKSKPEPRLSRRGRSRRAGIPFPESDQHSFVTVRDTLGNRVTLEAAALARQVSYPAPGQRRAGRINPPG